MPAKPDKTTTIEISIATQIKLHSLRDKIEKIVNPHGHKRKLSYDDTINIILDARGIEARLEEMIING
jgi:hypothetical protein